MKVNYLLSAAVVAFAAAFNTGGKWKVDAEGKMVVDADGNPIIILADGGERSVKGSTITELNGEAKTNRERAEKAEATLKAFEGIDPEKARAALETVGKIDAKKLIDAGEIDRVRNEIAAGFTSQIGERESTISTLQQRVNEMTIDREFARSKFIAEQIAVPREMFEATFGRNFKVEDGKVVPYDAAGNKIYSRKSHGEIAGVDEAFAILVEGYAHKDQILKAPNVGGSGGGGGGGNRGGSRTISRDEFNKLTPAMQAEAALAMGKGEVTIVD